MDTFFSWNWGWATLFALISYILLSLRIVGPKELGVLLFFGKPIKELRSGLVFVPWLICQLNKETRLTIQDELPADPQYIFRREDVEVVPPGFFPPIRIPFGFPRKELEKIITKSPDGKTIEHELTVPPEDDPLNIRITAEVVPVIRWRIENYIQFLITIGSREQARRQMEDCAVASLTREFAKITPAVALANLGTYSISLQNEIRARIENWGIKLESAQIKIINFHRDLNDAISAVPEAKLNAKAIITKSEAAKEQERLLGEGKGAAEKAVLDGRTAGFKKMMNDLNVSAEVILGAETARAITENPGQKTVIVGQQGFTDLIGIATGIGKTKETEKEKIK